MDDSEVSAEETSVQDIFRLSETAFNAGAQSTSSSDDESMEPVQESAVAKLICYCYSY